MDNVETRKREEARYYRWAREQLDRQQRLQQRQQRWGGRVLEALSACPRSPPIDVTRRYETLPSSLAVALSLRPHREVRSPPVKMLYRHT